MSKLLINEHPLQVLPTLAVKIGLNEAIFLQQLHYWLTNPKMGREYEGRKYIRNTFEEWQETNFPFWSLPTVKRTVKNLKKAGLVVSTGRLNKIPIDRTQWYTLDYEALEIASAVVEDDSGLTTRKCQNDTLAEYQNDTLEENEPAESIKMIRPEYQNDTMSKYQNDTSNNQRTPETTPEIKEGGKPPAPKRKARKKTPLPEALKVFQDEIHLCPAKNTWKAVTDVVTDLERWREVCHAWMMQQNNPRNLTGVLDWYRNGIPAYARPNGGQTNGSYSRSTGTRKTDNQKANAKLKTFDFRQSPVS